MSTGQSVLGSINACLTSIHPFLFILRRYFRSTTYLWMFNEALYSHQLINNALTQPSLTQHPLTQPPLTHLITLAYILPATTTLLYIIIGGMTDGLSISSSNQLMAVEVFVSNMGRSSINDLHKPSEEVTEAPNKQYDSTTQQDNKDQDTKPQFTVNSRYYIDTDFDEFIDNKMDETKERLIKQLRQIFSIPEEYIINVILSAGSVIIDLNITSDKQFDENTYLNETFVLTDFKERQHLVRKLMSSEDKDKFSTTTEGGAEQSTAPTESMKTTSKVAWPKKSTKATTRATTEPAQG